MTDRYCSRCNMRIKLHTYRVDVVAYTAEMPDNVIAFRCSKFQSGYAVSPCVMVCIMWHALSTCNQCFETLWGRTNKLKLLKLSYKSQ